MIFQAASWWGSKKMAGRAMSKVGPAVWPGFAGPTGKAVSTGPRSRITWFIRCLAVRARVLTSAAVSPWWM